MREADTRLVPYERIEVSHATNRPYAERPPVPRVGDELFYRRNYWDQDPVRARVVWVQDLDDREDPNLWALVRDHNGNPILDAGVPRYGRAADPWPEVRLRGEWADPGSTPHEREAITREARLRGSPGWLPLNWRERPVRLPSELYLIERPPLPPANVPYAEFLAGQHRLAQGG